MKAKSIWRMALCVATLALAAMTPGCNRDGEVAAADRAAAEKAAASAAADKAAADKAAAAAAADKIAADKLVADKMAADKAAADKLAAAKAAADKAAAEKAIADKALADKAAAAKEAAQAVAEAAALPPDLGELKAEISRMTSQIDLTMAKLDTLCAATGDLEKPSENALAAIEALDAEAQVLRARGDQMRDRGAAYFEVWEQQLASISTPAVAEIAKKRKDELAGKYEAVLTSMQETRAAMDAYWADMGTIRTAIEEELTADTQKLLVPRVKAAKDKATTLKSRIEGTFQKLGEISLIYTKP